MSKYSFLVPSYNVEKYINRCVTSLLNQTYTDFEIVIMDDCSSDGSFKISQKFEKENPKKIRTYCEKQNVGSYQIRFNLLKKSKGNYVIFIDSDDYVDERLLEVVDKYINETNCDVLIYDFYGEYRYRFGIKRLKKIQMGNSFNLYRGDSKVTLYQEFTTGRLNSIWRKVFRREMLKQEDIIKNFNKKSIGEDVLMTMAIFTRAQTIGYINEPLYYYQRNMTSLTRSSDLDSIVDCNMRIAQEIKKYLDIWNIDDRTRLYRYYEEYLLRKIKQIFLIEEKEKVDLLCTKICSCVFYDEVLSQCEITTFKHTLLKLCKEKKYEILWRILRKHRMKMRMKNIAEWLLFPINN